MREGGRAHQLPRHREELVGAERLTRLPVAVEDGDLRAVAVPHVVRYHVVDLRSVVWQGQRVLQRLLLPGRMGCGVFLGPALVGLSRMATPAL
jgi:hypothetical protein